MRTSTVAVAPLNILKFSKTVPYALHPLQVTFPPLPIPTITTASAHFQTGRDLDLRIRADLDYV
jgi:hypothetical protein